MVDPDEMQLYAAFHPGFHCLLKYRFRCFQYKKEFKVFAQCAKY